MKTIKINDPQPVACIMCGGFYGYEYSDLYRLHYMSVHKASGEYERGDYSSGRLIHKAKSAFCANCGAKLPFKLIREDSETV